MEHDFELQQNEAETHPSAEQELLQFAQLTDRVRVALAPVSPSASFRHKLEQELTRTVPRRVATGRDVRVERPARKDWLVGAAVILVGGIAYWMRSRSRPGQRPPL